jgi:hypothetical protein
MMIDFKATNGDGIGAVRNRKNSIWIFSEFRQGKFGCASLEGAHLRFPLIANG